VKLPRLSGTPVAIAFTLACAGAVVACQGDDSTSPPDSAATGGGAGASDATGSGGGTGGQADTGGQSDATGQGGASGQGGTAVVDSGPDVRADVSAGGGGSPASDASDASATSDRSEGAVSDGAPEASPGPCPIIDDAGGDGGFHYQLYSFNPANTTDLAAWSTFNMGPIASSVDDSTPESATSGSLHATIIYSTVTTFPVLESYHAVPLNFSCFNTLHISVKITPPVTPPFVILYVTSGAAPNGPGYYSMNLLSTAGIGDGNWHDLTADLNGGTAPANKAAIQRIGFQLFSPQLDGGGAAPPNLDIFIDNVWLE